MTSQRSARVLMVAGVFVLGWVAGELAEFAGSVEAQPSNRVFELRTYTAAPGKLAAVNARFADHTVALFERHGMTNIGYFTPQDDPLAANTLIYLLAHNSRAAAEASWAAFRADPEWQRVVEETQRDGRIVENVVSVFLDPTDYSQMH
jgi:hypothetical protein